MIKRILLTTFLLQTLLSFSQKQNNIWYFGDKAGINFNSGTATLLTNSNMRSFEGTAVISDTAGNILFYTNGGKFIPSPADTFYGGVWNRNHVIMPNGSLNGTGGCNSAVQSSLIVPNPADPDQYYFFTTDCQEYQMLGGFRYSIVDMSLDGGLGDITVKSVKLLDSVAESICGIMHENKTDFWVIAHKLYTSQFYAYKINASGIQPPVISDIGMPVYPNAGQMMSTINGTKIGYCVTYKSMLFDFNKNTGALSNFIDLNKASWGCAFSSNCRFFYTTSNDPPDSKIYQFDLNAANIPASAKAIHAIPHPYGPMQLGPDRKIYHVPNDFPYQNLNIINNPNLPDTACNFVANGFNLGGKVSKASLPNFISGFYGYCTSSSDIYQNTDEIQFVVYPNPSSGDITIKFSNPEGVSHNLIIYNILGSIVHHAENINAQEFKIDKKNLYPGVYYFQIFENRIPKGTGRFVME
jgi:hypothetical protein